MGDRSTVWVLTEEYNDYDQHGAYFVAVFLSKPSIEQLAECCADHKIDISCTIAAGIKSLHHLRNGGGRIGTESVWYNLEEVEVRQ